MVKAIESYDEFKTLISGSEVVVVDYWATWCGPCRMISPVFAKLEQTYPTVKFVKVDVDEQQEVASEQGIRSMPTFRAYKNGEQIAEVIGAAPPKLSAMLEQVSTA